MMLKIFFVTSFFYSLLFSSNALARCAVCYTNGLSGASIAVIVIVTSFVLLFFANKILKKIIDKRFS